MSSKTEKADMIAMRFFNEEGVIHFNGSFFLYNDGIWRIESYENTMAWIGSIYRKIHAEACEDKQLRLVRTFIERETYQKYRKRIKYINGLQENPREINLKSGILNLDTMKTRDYSKEEFRFHKLPFNYKRETNCPQLARFLSSSMSYNGLTDNDLDDEFVKLMKFIQEWMGYTIISGNPYQKSLIMTGSGRNGKGTLLWLWKKLLHKTNFSSLDLSLFTNINMLSELENKLVNFSSDINDGQKLDTGIMKRLTSEEEITIRRLYQNPRTMKFSGKIIMVCNNLPNIGTVNPSVWGRFHLLPFNRTFTDKDMDINLKDKLEGELEDIFSWTVNGYIRLRERGRFDMPERCKFAMGEYLRDYDKIAQWLEEGGLERQDKDDRCKRDVLWRDYRSFCHLSGYRSGTIAEFYRKMEKRGFKGSKINGTRYINGIHPPENTTLENR